MLTPLASFFFETLDGRRLPQLSQHTADLPKQPANHQIKLQLAQKMYRRK
jgi:hypothetical protein